MINTESASTFFRSLQAAIEDGGQQALTVVAECAAAERELDIKGPCVAALACWGEAGFEKMVANALRNRTSKDISAALKTLALIAAGKTISSLSSFMHDDKLLDRINQSISGQNLQGKARRKLSELVMSLPTHDLLIPLGTAFTQIGIAGDDGPEEIVGALSSKWLGFGPRDLEAFALLISHSSDDEPKLHSFLETFPQILDPMAAQVWSKPDFHGFKIPDFLIRRSDNSYLVVEIETPAKTLVTRGGQMSAYVTQAVKQAIDYRAFVLERLSETRHHFPEIHDPDALVVIGLEEKLSKVWARTLQEENRARTKLRIVGFDWLLHRARAVLSNVTGSKIEVIKNYRVV